MAFKEIYDDEIPENILRVNLSNTKMKITDYDCSEMSSRYNSSVISEDSGAVNYHISQNEVIKTLEKEFIWQYFKRKNKDKKYVMCTLCQELQYHGGLTKKQIKHSMKSHLKHRHLIQYKDPILFTLERPKSIFGT